MFKQKKNVSTKNIVTIDPYQGDAFVFSGNEVNPLDLSKAKNYKSNFYVSYLKFKSISTNVIEIPKNIDDDEIANAIFVKAYEDLGLDSALDYKISYLELNKSRDDSRLFSVFAVETNSILNTFKGVENNTKYIDHIALAPLLYSSLYKKNLLEKFGVDCFINLSKDDAFLTVYNEGEHFLSRSLRFNLSYIKDKFSEQMSERIDEQKFYNMLKEFGVCIGDEDNASPRMLSYVMEDCFFYIEEVLKSLSISHSLNFNNIFLDIETGPIKGLDEFVSNKLKISAKDLQVNTLVKSKKDSVSQRHNLMSIFALFCEDGDFDETNFSLFLRPDPFLKRKSGHLIMYCLAGFLLSFAYPAFNYGYGYYLESMTDIMTQEYDELRVEEERIKNELRNLEARREGLQKQLVAEDDNFRLRKDLLDQIVYKKNYYKMKSIALFDLSEYLNANNVRVNKLDGDNQKMIMLISADTDKKITDLIKDITASKAYSVTTKEIYSVKEPVKKFESNITVEMMENGKNASENR